MQQVICVDTTINPVQIILAEVVTRTVRPLKETTLSLEDSFYGPFFQCASVPGGGTEHGQESGEKTQEQQQVEKFKAALAEIEGEATASLLIIPAVDCFAMRLDLPFSDGRLVKKILPVELQDATPFRAEDFALTSQYIGPNEDGKHSFNVSAIARDYFSKVLRFCQQAGFNPSHVTSPSGVLAALPYLAGDLFQQPSAIITSRTGTVYFAACINGRVSFERFLPQDSLGKETCTNTAPGLKQSIAASERLFNVKIEKVFLLDQHAQPRELSQKLGRQIESINSSELIKGASHTSGLALLGTVLIQDQAEVKPLSNYRTGDFRYGLQLKQLKAGLRRLSPYFLTTFLILALSGTILFLFVSHQVGRVNKAIRQQIERVIPSFPVPRENVIEALAAHKNQLTTQLGALGSDSRYSPLDALALVSRDINLSSDQKVRINRLRISGSQITLEGHASEASAIERLETTLRRKRKVYCRIKRPSISGSYNFTLEFHLCG